MKKYIISILVLLLGLNLSAQNKDEVIFKAMTDELNRNMADLKLDKFDPPFFISYILFDGEMLNIKSTLGSTVYVDERPIRYHGVRTLLGDYDCMSDVDYNSYYTQGTSAVGTDYGQLRREFWITTDNAYKRSMLEIASKQSIRNQRVRTKEEAELPDMVKIEPITMKVEGPAFSLDRAEWEKNVNRLSAIFKNYPSLYRSSVMYDSNDFSLYLTTSEGTVVKQPVNYATISVTATVKTGDGIEYTDTKELYTTSDKTLPSMEELTAMVTEFAQTLVDYANAPVIEEFYSGPVLFVDEVVASIFSRTLLSNAGVFSKRKSEASNVSMSGYMFSSGPANTSRYLQHRIGQRVLDGRLTVKNVPSMKEFGGVDLLGYYEVDAEGVVPPAELTLIENGVMKQLLSGRTPTPYCKNTTGSQRFIVSESRMATGTAPGNIVISTEDGKSRAELEKELVRLAKEDGLKYAYIISKIGGDESEVSHIYRVDVGTGVKTLVRAADPAAVTLGQLKKIAGISNESVAYNYLALRGVPASVVCPGALLLENVEISEMQVERHKSSPLVNPLERTVSAR